MEYFLGLDGGGTKTEMVLVDEGGHLVSHGVGDGCNPNRCSDDELRRIVADNIGLLMRSERGAASRLAVVFAGVAGASHPKNGARLQAALGAALPRGTVVRVSSDTVPALWSGTRGSPGIALIAGTGATAYGEDGRGGWHRAGGWGYLVGDDGSGYALGREAVREVCRFFDGSGEPTIMWDKLAAAHGLTVALDLVPFVYSGPRPPFDQLVPLVLEAYREGDACARRVVERTVADQRELIRAVHRSLDFSRRSFALVLRGGLLKVGGVIRPLLETALEGMLAGTRYHLESEEAPPVYGSALLALSQGGKLSEPVARTLLAQMREAGLSPKLPGA